MPPIRSIVLLVDAGNGLYAYNSAALLARPRDPDQQGRYEIKGLPAGEYLAVGQNGGSAEDGHVFDPNMRPTVGKRMPPVARLAGPTSTDVH
jgi:hypothetical protein